MSQTATTSLDTGQRRRFGAALAILRGALGLFLLVWGLEKFIVTEVSVAIYGFLYGVPLSNAVTYLLGVLESALALAIILGLWRRWSYGIGLLAHGATTIATAGLIIEACSTRTGESSLSEGGWKMVESDRAETAGGMLCPSCKVALVMSERQNIEIDYCPRCRGVWLDRGELDKIIERSLEQERKSGPPPAAGFAGGYPGGYPGKHGGKHGYRRKSWLHELFD